MLFLTMGEDENNIVVINKINFVKIAHTFITKYN